MQAARLRREAPGIPAARQRARRSTTRTPSNWSGVTTAFAMAGLVSTAGRRGAGGAIGEGEGAIKVATIGRPETAAARVSLVP